MQGKILVVDDDNVALKNLARFLVSQGYDVASAGNGKEALKLLEQQRFDLVLTDVVMPVVDGKQLLTEVRSRCESTPVILMSGNFTSVSPAIFYLRANGYVLKPIDLKKLLHKIKDVLTENSATV